MAVGGAPRGPGVPGAAERRRRKAEKRRKRDALRAELAAVQVERAAAELELQKLAAALPTQEVPRPRGAPGWRDWAGLPAELLAKVAGKVVAQNEAAQAALLKGRGWGDEYIQMEMAKRKREGNCLFVFAMVCKPWRKAQLEVGARLCTRVWSDVVLPGSVALVKWALAEGCPTDDGVRRLGWDGVLECLVAKAAGYGHLELVQWLCGEGGFAVDSTTSAAPTAVVAAAAPKPVPAQVMSFEQKRKLSVGLGMMPADKLARVVEIINSGPSQLAAGDDDEIELDIDALDNATLWKLDDYVNACKKKKPKSTHDSLSSRVAAWIEQAAWGGNLEMVQWLKERFGLAMNEWRRKAYLYAAAKSGNLELVRWLRAAGCDFSYEACEQAAEGGHLGILQWLRAEGCPWGAGTCYAAVEHGHVEVLRWARENGCEWDAGTRDQAAEELGYTDNLGNLYVDPDDEFDDEFDDEYGYGDGAQVLQQWQGPGWTMELVQLQPIAGGEEVGWESESDTYSESESDQE